MAVSLGLSNQARNTNPGCVITGCW